MPLVRLAAPRQFDLPSALAFATQIANVPYSSEYEIDFSKVGLVEPFPMLLVASCAFSGVLLVGERYKYTTGRIHCL